MVVVPSRLRGDARGWHYGIIIYCDLRHADHLRVAYQPFAGRHIERRYRPQRREGVSHGIY